jgi:hypothetical protein
MNWSGKAAVLFAFVTVLLTACELPREIGLPTGNLVDIRYTDTLTIRASTVLLDSIHTSGAAQMLVGSYTDPLFGKVSARAYAEFAPIRYNLNQEKVYQYDSAAVFMSYSSSGFYGDTLQPFSMNVHRLKDTLITGKTYYNYNTTPYDPSVFFNFSFSPQSSVNTLTVKLPDTFGRQIFGLMFGSGRATNPSAFVKEMKGFALIPSPNNKAIVGFSSENIQVVLFFHENGVAGRLY